MKRFENREEAGKLLAERLLPYRELDPIILALPRGGVPLGRIIANRLSAPLDIILIRKIGAPGNEEFAVGAVAEDEKPILNNELISMYNLDRRLISGIIADQVDEIRKRAKLYRQYYKPVSWEGRTVIVVDDGLATGATMKAALLWLKTKVIKEIIVAVPVASKEAREEITPLCNEFISLIVPENLWSVGFWYHDFKQVSDEEVLLDLKNGSDIDENEIRLFDHHAEGNEPLNGFLQNPLNSKGLIVFAHGAGSNYRSPRNQKVAKALHEAGYATLLFDLLTASESMNRKNVFDIPLMARRLTLATEWAKKNFPQLPMAYFGASTGAAAALTAAADRDDIFAIVSRGGRPDMAMDLLPKITIPVLLIVGKEDDMVIPLNRAARNKLVNCQMELIARAGHLFEEPGTMDQVIELAVGWFNQHNVKKKIKKPMTAKENIVLEIEKNSTPFNKMSDLKEWINEISKHRIVMFGEATHGTKEFYHLRSEISKILMEKHGYQFIAVEGDWPDCQQLNQYINSENTDAATNVVRHGFHRWPTWMWANEEIPSIIEWMKKKKMGGFYGLDVYSLFESIDAIKTQVEKYDSNLAYKIMDGYNCFESFERNEMFYAESLLKLPAGCQEEVINNLRELLRLRVQDTKLTKNQLFDVQQNARVINNAEKYYRTMLSGGADSWNIRDNHMMETLENLLHHYSSDTSKSKAIVWAHNTHIGDYHATDMGDSGYINLGGLAREKFGVENVYLVGFGTHHGKVTAGKAWKTPQETMELPSAQAGSYEDYFHKASIALDSSQFVTKLNHLDKFSPLYHKLGHRAVGVVYDPEYEKHGHNYVPTELANRYDSFIFVDETNALKSLPTIETYGQFPESYPTGQ